MKHLLLPLLAALALPTAVNAESYWLILVLEEYSGVGALEKIEVSSMDECSQQGKRWRESYRTLRNYWCIKGK